MFKTIRGRLITLVVVAAIAGWQLYDNGIKLGLDLLGGMHLVLEVDDQEGTMTAESRADAIDRAERTVRNRIDEFGVEEPIIQKIGAERLIVELAGVREPERAREIVSQSAFLEFKLVMPVAEVQQALPRMDRAIVAALGADSLRRMGRDKEGPAESGSNVQDLLFGAKDSTQAGDSANPADSTQAADSADASPSGTTLRPLTALLSAGQVEGTFLVDTLDVATVDQFVAIPEVARLLPRGISLEWSEATVPVGARTYRALFVLQDDAFMTGEALVNAIAARDQQSNAAQVQFELNRIGGRSFERFTSQHVGDNLAIVLDNQVVSAPVIRDRIGARGQIDLGNTANGLEEARDLALVLRSGALPAPLKVIEERQVGPSLGADSIEKGKFAGIVGVFLVMLIMILYYRVAGFLAVAALSVYVLLVMGALAGFGANLTLPGLAGVLLSIGMAVDANILIFERIREELAAGRANRSAMEEGFHKALSAILDSNLSSLITALVLYQIGTGPIRGFAVTLSIGVVASFFSAIFTTRTFFMIYLSRLKSTDPISI
jgi:protein-export membrane protein SecD